MAGPQKALTRNHMRSSAHQTATRAPVREAGVRRWARRGTWSTWAPALLSGLGDVRWRLLEGSAELRMAMLRARATISAAWRACKRSSACQRGCSQVVGGSCSTPPQFAFTIADVTPHVSSQTYRNDKGHQSSSAFSQGIRSHCAAQEAPPETHRNCAAAGSHAADKSRTTTRVIPLQLLPAALQQSVS